MQLAVEVADPTAAWLAYPDPLSLYNIVRCQSQMVRDRGTRHHGLAVMCKFLMLFAVEIGIDDKA